MKTIITILALLFLAQPCLAQDSFFDSDNDEISNADENLIYHTDPYNKDTDGDGYDDKLEIDHRYSPLFGEGKKSVDVDSDQDGLNDLWEIIIGTNLAKTDTDGDGYDDWTEVYHGYSPLNPNPQLVEKTIKVDIAKQTLHYTFDGKLLDNFYISGGTASMPTPKGEFRILAKNPSKDYGGRGYNFYYPGTKWNLHFTTDYWRYYIHGAYWHNNFGHPMSHGCVNVAYQNMENLYNWTNIGTKVLIY